MGMATIDQQQALTPASKNVTVCGNCNAQYKKDAAFVRGYRVNDNFDTGELKFNVAYRVPHGCCPVCLTPNAAISRERSESA